MNIQNKIILLVFIISYLYFTLHTRNKIKETTYLNNYQKKVHYFLIWVIPYLWGMLILRIINPDELKTITKKDRKTDKSNFYESRKGFQGGG